MKRPALAQDLVPVNEFRANMATWMHRLEESGRPVVLTQRGRAAAMLIDPRVFDELDAGRELVKRVLAGLEEVEAGAVHEDAAVWDDVESILTRAEEGERASKVD